ncbi:UvrD-helicase domain-containing protein [Xylanibacter caecicola]|uniref:UvrD-helicase domain-containing protein n=1 Tax=Xylanibacter caecicola TaxID=2736294 RepID=UPI00258F3442|nr:UvrD-helicase domain-containing protein [Xylanibacter caecicola]
MKPLVVYNASAGSGKTFTLATEYIKLLIENPQSYRNILAVTFTNKATEEMKMRILSQLYGIWKLLPDSEGYINVVTEQLGISKEYASRQAGKALGNLMHNYSYFHVQTIDTFFQGVLRNLSRELELTTNLRLALNDNQAETFAVDRLIESLDSSSIVLKWIISLILENIDDDKGWNIISDIKHFGKNIFNNVYRQESPVLNEKISERNFFEDYIKELNGIIFSVKKQMEAYADMFEKTLSNAGLVPEDLKSGTRGIAGYFKKLRGNDFSDGVFLTKTLEKCLASPQEWASKTSPYRDVIVSLAETQLMGILENAENDRTRLWRLCSSAMVTLQYLSQLRLLNNIEKKMREINADTNQFLLSDTQQLLHGLINGSDSPFIFEKIGARLEHIMIDEFQDTSTIQWKNFKILLEECMSNSDVNGDSGIVGNLIVGDVKQSIYRWRSGDWRLLNGIEKQFSSPAEQLSIRTLNTNYRSERNIVDFNNAFFKIAVDIEYEKEREINESEAHELKDAYADVCQTVPSGKEERGLAEITLLPKFDYQENTLLNVKTRIMELIDAGVCVDDIAILVRTKKHIPVIAEYFSDTDIKIVSDEAFRIGSSVAVNIIIGALRYLSHPDDILTKAELIKNYRKFVIDDTLTDNDLFISGNNDDSFLPEEFVKNFEKLPDMPLFDLIEHIYHIFCLDTLSGQSAFICSFYDCVSAFVKDNPADIDGLLDEWEENIRDKTIQSDDVNGIRIISIHKSKGLEFDNVIIPFCDWEIEKYRFSETLWCRPSVAPFNKLPVIPVRYGSKLLDTIYADDYRHEHMQNTVDNLNLLYVAFTRAGKNLFIIGKQDAKNSRSTLLQECLPKLHEELPQSTFNETEDEGATFSYGKLYISEKKERRATANVFMQPQTPLDIKIESFGTPVKFVQSNKSRAFINDDGDESDRNEYITIGNVMHNVFSRIRTTADVDSVLRQLEFEGVLDTTGLSADKVRTMLAKRFADKRVADWFSPHWQLFNECEILSFDHDTGDVIRRRPDRVMTDGERMIVVDFKFGRPKDEYPAQVREYMNLLGSMGYTNISGYLWFVYTNKIVEVKN